MGNITDIPAPFKPGYVTVTDVDGMHLQLKRLKGLRPAVRAVVNFTVEEGCAPCKTYAPYFRDLAYDDGGRNLYIRAVVPHLFDLGRFSRYGVSAAPTVMIFNHEGLGRKVEDRYNPLGSQRHLTQPDFFYESHLGISLAHFAGVSMVGDIYPASVEIDIEYGRTLAFLMTPFVRGALGEEASAGLLLGAQYDQRQIPFGQDPFVFRGQVGLDLSTPEQVFDEDNLLLRAGIGHNLFPSIDLYVQYEVRPFNFWESIFFTGWQLNFL